jgi:tetratricopeptide (TPR) repeat protein
MASTAQSSVPASGTAPQSTLGEEPSFSGWLNRNRKLVTYVGVAILVLAIGGWLYMETGRRRELAGVDALDRARAAFESGNLPAASTEFQRVAQSFRGTEAGFAAELALNEVRLASGQAQIAADELKKFADAGPPAFFASGAWGLRGGALENLQKFDEAAESYGKAAAIAEENYRKVDALLGQARSLRLAGKTPQALDLYRQIISTHDRDVAGVPEAEVRLAELTRGSM